MRTIEMLIAACLAWAVATGAAAQPPGGGRAGAMPPGRAPPADASIARAPGGGVEQLQLQLAELEEDLKLAPAQRKAWALYADRARSLAGDIARNRAAVRFPKGSVAQQFDFLTDTLRNRLTAFEDVAEAAKALYAMLTPDQQEVADRRLARVAVSLLDVGAGAPGFAGGPSDGGGRTNR